MMSVYLDLIDHIGGDPALKILKEIMHKKTLFCSFSVFLACENNTKK